MHKTLSWLLGTALCIGTIEAHASGIALLETSVSGLGNAYAGGAAIADDATTIYSNPAGMTRFCRIETSFGAHAIMPGVRFKNQGSTIYPPIAALSSTSSAMTGGDGKNVGSTVVVGNSYILMPICKDLVAGIGINTPFGLVTDYGNNWVGRYHAVYSALTTININPSIAYRINKCWSVGIGFNAMYLHSKITNKIDYGTIAWLGTLGLGGGAAAAQAGLTGLGFLPQTQDGNVRIEGHSWGYGVNAGVLWEPECGTRIGFHYRSHVKQNFRGRETFSDLPAQVANPSSAGGLAAFFQGIQAQSATNTKTRASVTLPMSLELSVYRELNRCLAVMVDVLWMNWKQIDELRFKFDNAAQPDAVITTQWKNAYRLAVGFNYTPWECLVFRTGVAYDKTPIPNPSVRSPRIPDDDRIWVTVGSGYRYSKCLHFDIAYAHIFARDPKVDKSTYAHSEDVIRGGLKGRYQASTDILSAQLNYSF